MMQYVHPDSLHSVWDFVKEGLDRILARSPDRWKPEDVYWMLKTNNYFLHVYENKAFAILQPISGWDGKEVFVFAAYIVPGEGCITDCLNDVKRIATEIGAKRVKFQSKRDGWLKRAEQLGYKESYREFELEL